MAAVDAAVQEVYSAIQKNFIKEGRAPHYTELAGLILVDIEEARRLQREALKAGVGAWPLADTDYVESFAPFYNGPTNVRIGVDGEQKWNAQCGLEGLAVRWVFSGKEVRLDALCLDCGQPIVMRFLDEEILEVTPESTVGFMNQSFNSEFSGEMTGGYF